jgi:hypothetical protein
VKIKRLSFLPAGSADGSFASKAIAASEHIRAATGVDLTEVTRRFVPPSAPPAQAPVVTQVAQKPPAKPAQ